MLNCKRFCGKSRRSIRKRRLEGFRYCFKGERKVSILVNEVYNDNGMNKN